MLKMFLKSAMYYTFWNKYKNRVLLIVSILIFMVFVLFIYDDINEYLVINNLKSEIIYALVTKWTLLLLSIGGIVYITTFNFKNQYPNPTKKNKVKPEIEIEVQKKDTLKSSTEVIIDEIQNAKMQQPKDDFKENVNQVEITVKNKKKLRTQSDLIIEELKAKKCQTK